MSGARGTMKRRLPLIVAVIVFALPGGAGASNPTQPVIRGTIYDAYGQRVKACVTAVDIELSPFVSPPRIVVESADDGSYQITLPHQGVWRLVAADYASWWSPPRCPGINDGRGSRKFNNASVFVTTPDQIEPVDFTLSYHLGAAMEGTHGNRNELVAGRPGALKLLYASLHKTVADRAVVVFRDQETGTEVTLNRRDLEPGGEFAYYQDSTFTIPAARPDGDYAITYRVVDPGGAVANDVIQTLTVDGVAPEIGATYPGDDAQSYPDLRVWLAATDGGSGLHPYAGRVRIYDVGGSSRTFVIAESLEPGAGGTLQSRDEIALAENRAYEAEITVVDHAGNGTRKTVPFTTIERGPQMYAHSPTGEVSTRSPVIEIRYGLAVDPSAITFRLQRLSEPKMDIYVSPTVESAIRRAWVRPGSLDVAELARAAPLAYYAPLLDGTYRVTIYVVTFGRYHVEPFSWEFQVHSD